MTIFGGGDYGVASPIAYSGSSLSGTAKKVSDKEPASYSGSVSEGIATASPSKEEKSSSGGKSISIPSFDDSGTPHWEEAAVEPENAIDIALPGFSDDGTPHWEEHKVSTEGVEPAEQHLDVDKLLGYQNEGYKLYSDGEGGFTQDPNSKNGIYYPEGSIKSKRQTTTTENQYMNGDDYVLDDSYFANAQAGTGEAKEAAAVVGGGGGSGKDNSVNNHNDAMFGGEKQKATPGKSLLPDRFLF